MLGEIVGDGDVPGEIVGKCRGVEICHEGQVTARAASKKGVEASVEIVGDSVGETILLF